VIEFKDWKGCKQMCQSHTLSLLKIDDYNELVSWALTFTFILLSFTLEQQDIEDRQDSGKKISTIFLCVLLSAM
jgi:hypothetical protein